MRLITTVLLTAALCVGAWSMRNTDVARSLMQATKHLPASLHFGEDSNTGIGDGLSTIPNLGGPKVHKCLTDKEVLYTSESCPAGTQEQALTKGTLSVVPGQPETKVPKVFEQAASRPTVRDLLAPEREKFLRDQWMDRVIGQ